MKFPKNALSILTFWMVTLMFIQVAEAQTKRLKRPNSSVGISSVDNFVKNSFDIYDKVYKYDGYAAAGTPLDDDDIDVLEDALNDLDALSNSAPNILSDLDGTSVLKKGKATLQMNKAKKALSYSITTAKELLLGQREYDKDDEGSETATGESNETSDNPSQEGNVSEDIEDENISDNLEVYSKFDYVPGDKLIYFDDFSQDFVGDFPSKWNTNGSGEVVRLSKAEGNWFQMKSGYNIMYIPLIPNKLPEEYTIEFDLFTEGLDNRTSSNALLLVTFDDNNGFKKGRDYAYAAIPFGQYGAFGIRVRNTNPTNSRINNTITADIRKAVLNNPHISLAVNKQRFRLWVNEIKYIDIPQFIYSPEKIGFLKFNLEGLRDGVDKVFIGNIKIAEGGVDLRRKLMSEGRISTNGILFDSGSANIKPQSYGIIRQISQVLLQDESINLNIVGHTDSDGTEDDNLKLSKARADAVKQALINIYNISGNRLQTDGKGESTPVADNSTSNGKAQNRRVEFIKI
ncbi:OmpA family protein [Sabulilitoribacter multivorans]|uniref:OmpA family protein n=1 Tax=Flaviramulus multivorans TaxID=1304750 RepID=A0ABS9IK40_9FLAO|nr:OmpA family protein [Flaviramulus multivorans]MCF7560957.1 OmpA family protein [Flaviramulus multivorans]